MPLIFLIMQLILEVVLDSLLMVQVDNTITIKMIDIQCTYQRWLQQITL